MPLKTLKEIKRPTREKIVLFIVFGIGGLSCISRFAKTVLPLPKFVAKSSTNNNSAVNSIIRLYTIKVFTASKDPFYDGVPINVWSMIEINIAIVCASVPGRCFLGASVLDRLLTRGLAMKPLFTKSARERVTNSKNSPSGFGSRYSHQMIPLSGNDKSKPKSTYNAQSAGNHRVGSEEHIISHKGGVIEYEREFTVEESYIGAPRGDSTATAQVLKA
jgi:hypothetical protein